MAIPSGEKTAFTLIELLVVIAIIALLLAVVLPALGKAKDIAKRVLCTSNLRQTGVGLRIYGGDHDEKLMPLMHVQSDKSYVPGSSAATATTSPTQPLPWNAVITHLRDRYTSDGIHLKPYHLGLLYTYNYISEPKIFYCPAQPRNESYAIGYHYDDYTENGSREWGTFVPEFPQSGHNSFVRTSYNYWIYDKTRYDELGVKPILVDNLQEWEVLPHRKGRCAPAA